MSLYSFNELYDYDVKTIYDIKQDSKGDFWFGTSQGIFRFDGKYFQQFSFNKYDKEYTGIKFDKDDRPYFVNFGGQLFRINEDTVEVILEGTLDGKFVSNYLLTDSAVYYDTGLNSLYRLDLQTRKDQFIDIKPHIKGGKNRILHLRKEGDAIIILSSLHYIDSNIIENRSHNSSLCIHEVDLKAFNEAKLVKSGRPVKNKSSAIILNYANNTYSIIEFYRKQRFSRWNLTTDSLEISETKFNELISINSAHWLNKELYFFNKKSILKFNNSQDLITVAKNINATCMYSDREGNYWIGTLDKGIYVCPTKQITKSKFEINEISNSVIDSKTKRLFYVSSTGEVCAIDYPYTGNKGLISSNGVPRLRIAINPFKRELILNTHSKAYDLDNYSSSTKTPEYFKDRLYLSNDSYFLAGPSNLSFYGDANPFKTDSNEPKKGKLRMLRPYRALDLMIENDQSHVYVNFIDGLFVYAKTESPWAIYHNGSPILVSSLVNEADRDGIWVGSKQNELFYIKNGTIIQYVKLPEQPLKLSSYKGYVFILGEKNLFRFDKKTQELYAINETDGLEVSDIISLYTFNDTTYCFGNHGCQKVPIDYRYTNEITPLITINKIRLFDQEIPFGQNIFEFDQNQITFDFTVSSIRSKKRYEIKYRLNFEPWRSTSWESPFVRYDKLAPGDYYFQAYVVNEDGVQSESVSYRFSIDAPLYQKWWFILLLILGVVLILFLLFLWYVSNIRKQKSLEKQQESYKKELYKSKISTIRAQMNPHFMFNALNTIQDFILSNDSKVASEYLADFADLMRMYLDQSRLDFITLQEEIETTLLYLKLEKLRFGDDFNFEIVVDSDLDVNEVDIPVMILQPIIENAIKHGLLHQTNHRNLFIEFKSKDNEHFQVIIEDNGIGFEASLKQKSKQSKHKSFASNAINERLNLIKLNYNKSISMDIIHKKDSDQHIGEGTIVVLTIPLHIG